jgi:guanylate kinase/adenylate cyclase class IV
LDQNFEAKFLPTDEQEFESVLRDLNFLDEQVIDQEDIYALAPDAFFKLRINNKKTCQIIKYNRLTSPVIRESTFEKVDIKSNVAADIAKFIFSNIARAGVVKKRRRRLESREFLVNMDMIFDDDGQNKLFTVVEIEYFAGKDASNIPNKTAKIMDMFGLKPYQIIPYSNIHMVNMFKASRAHRISYRKSGVKGKLVLVDGGSGTGKSTVKDLLMKKWNHFYARRDTTRSPRPDDFLTDDYNFVSPQEFRLKALGGQYIEFRDFLFGMSYGLAWSDFIPALIRGENVMALINLGNGYLTKLLFPDAAVVLLYAELATIKSRLERRGALTTEQIEERLENNRLAISYADAYDYAINTSAYDPDEVARQIIEGPP